MHGCECEVVHSLCSVLGKVEVVVANSGSGTIIGEDNYIHTATAWRMNKAHTRPRYNLYTLLWQ